MELKDKIRLQRKSARLNQEKLSELIGVSSKTIQRWESGERSPRLEEIEKLAEALGTTVGALMGETPEPEAAPKNPNENLPINNTPENETPEYLDLGYWGNVAENARKIVKKGNVQEKAVAQMMVRIASEALNGVEKFSDAVAKISQRADNIHGNVSQSVGK